MDGDGEPEVEERRAVVFQAQCDSFEDLSGVYSVRGEGESQDIGTDAAGVLGFGFSVVG